jgi:hypothetical protein
VAKSATTFQVTNVGADVEFVRDDQGHVAKLLIRINGQQMEAKPNQVITCTGGPWPPLIASRHSWREGPSQVCLTGF